MKGTFELYKNGEMIASKVAANGTATFTPQGSITDLNNGVYEVKETQAAGDEYNLPAKNQPMAYVKANDDGEAMTAWATWPLRAVLPPLKMPRNFLWSGGPAEHPPC